MNIIDYHAHLYYDFHDIEEAKIVLEKVKEKFAFALGRAWDRTVGPHPIGSCQISVPVNRLEEFLVWMMEARGKFDVFVHANTGDDLFDHTQCVMWLGKSHKLNIDIFGK